MTQVTSANAKWALDRAMAFARKGDLPGAVRSAVADLEKIGAATPDQGLLNRMILGEATTAEEFEREFLGFAAIQDALQGDAFVSSPGATPWAVNGAADSGSSLPIDAFHRDRE